MQSLTLGAGILLLVGPELLGAERVVMARGAAPKTAARDGLGLRQVGSVVAGEMPLEVGLDLEPFALRAVVGVGRDLLGSDPVARVVGLLDLGELLAGQALLGFVGEIVRLELRGV